MRILKSDIVLRRSPLPLPLAGKKDCNDYMTWDRSLHWVLFRTHHHQFDVAVVLDNPLSTHTLAAIRKLDPELRNKPIGELKSRLSGHSSLPLGTVSGQRCREIDTTAQQLGLRLKITNSSFTSYLPVDKTNDQMWLIEDDNEAKKIVDEMIAAGIEVQDCEAD